jgi:chromosome segregation ATPase
MATSILIPWLLFAASVAVGLVALSRMRAADREVAQRDARITELDAALETAHQDTAKSVAKQHKLAEELEQARRKLDKARKRGERDTDRAKGGAARAASEPEGAIEAVRQERDAARLRADALTEELAKANERISAAAAADKPLLDNAAITALQKRLHDAQQASSKLGTELAEARAKSERAQKKHETDQLLYASMRGELAAKKDRLRTQTEELERLRAMKVAIANESD